MITLLIWGVALLGLALSIGLAIRVYRAIQKGDRSRATTSAWGLIAVSIITASCGLALAISTGAGG